MLNCVQETSVRAAVVLSVGLLRLVSRAWVVVAAVLSAVLVLLLLDVEAGRPRGGEDVLNVSASVVFVFAGVGMSRGVGRVQLCA